VTILLNCNLMCNLVHYASAGGVNPLRRNHLKIRHLIHRKKLLANGAARARSMPIMSINIIDFVA
jgi:hypothetical protein